VAADYFSAVGMRLHEGRTLTRDDIDRREPVVVVNEALAKTFLPGEDPIGKRLASNLAPAKPGEVPVLQWLTIVGVVSNTPIGALGEPFTVPHLFMPMSIAGGPDIPRLVGPSVDVMSYVVRSTTPPLGLVTPIRQAIAAVDPTVPVSQVRLLQDLVDRATAQMSFMMVLLVIAASVALTIGLIGIYGVMSYIVTQRTAEIGVRLALGAAPGAVAAMIVRQGGVVAIAGIAVGLVAALAGSRAIETLLYDVSPRDPAVFAATTMALLGVALLACWLPARRAANLSPVDALRAE
jgi:putative ABC transport system permease protein